MKLDRRMPLKICKRCEKSLPATTEFFYPHPATKDRLKPKCKACELEVQRLDRKTLPMVTNRPKLDPIYVPAACAMFDNDFRISEIAKELRASREAVANSIAAVERERRMREVMA
jgi:hypothetical protein